MAAINSLKDGYINETGVMSAAVSSTTSVSIGHRVMLPGNTATAIKSATFTSAVIGGYVNTPAGVVGYLAVADGLPGTLTVTNGSVAIRNTKVGGVIQVSGSPSIPQGQI